MFFVSILITISCFLFAPSPIHASESALSASPAIVEAIVPPGTVVPKEVVIENTTNFPLPIKAQSSAFVIQENSSIDPHSTFDASTWFNIEPSDFILQPHESKKILLNITAPLGVEPGGHYATVFFQPLIPEQAVSSNTTSLARIGILTFLVVPGNIQEKLEISSFTSSGFLRQGPAPFNLKLANTGNIHQVPQITVTILDSFGVNRATLTPPLGTILPGTTKDFKAVWEVPKLTLGYFTAISTITYGQDRQQISAEPIRFWIIPWPPIMIMFIILTIFYRLFIVNFSRVKLAWRVLKGQNVQIETHQKNPKISHH